MHASPTLLAAVLALPLSACGAVPLTSIPSLARINPSTTDFSAIKVALAAPRSIVAMENSVRVEFKSRVDDAPERTDSFPLAAVTTPVDLTDMVGSLPEGDALTVFAMPPAEAARLNAARDALLAERAAGRKVTGSLGVTAREFCLAGGMPDGKLLVTTYLYTSEMQRFVPLVRDFDVTSQPDLAAGLKMLPPCPAPATTATTAATAATADASQTRQ